MEPKRLNGNESERPESKDVGLIAITGAGGFIGGNLVKYFRDKGFSRIRAADKKPFNEWDLRRR